ncbi:MAG: hypothetical protein JSU68_10640, partial [Phycisphaerales bacterium]
RLMCSPTDSTSDIAASGASVTRNTAARRSDLRREYAYFLAIALAMVLTRGAFVWCEPLHFDSDQAVVGLMTLDLVQGKGFPVYFYGQDYLATLEPYLAAPVFAVCGPSRWALKLSLLVLGVVIAWMMYVAFRRDCRISPAPAALLVTPFVIPTVVMASRLVEANGANLDVFLFVMLLWYLRRHPLAAGLVAGLAVQNRMFGVYAVCSLLLVVLVTRRWSWWDYPIFAMASAATYVGISFLGQYSPNRLSGGLPVQISDAEDLIRLTRALTSSLLPLLYGLIPAALGEFRIRCDIVANAGLLGLVPGAAMLFLAAAALSRPGYRLARHWAFPCYLMGVGALSLVAFVFMQGNLTSVDPMRIRYILLSVLFLIGAAGLLWQTRRRRCVAAFLVLSAVVNVGQHSVLWARVLRDAPADEYADLAAAIRGMDLEAAIADYWTAYHVAFLLEGEVPVTYPAQTPRIGAYHDAYRVAPAHRRAMIRDVGECDGGPRVHGWVVCPAP